ncbi:TPA: LPXTG cell wall anchor domain-containing protein, partial [Enterococcus faecalis]|nr:LPXTG cell wall anchor domain-containing protein [Enterococcus faecalis]
TDTDTIIGQTVNDGSSFNEDITVFAQWEKESNLAGEVHAPQGPIEEGKSIVLNNVVQSNKSGSVIVTGELPKGLVGLSINETGNLIGTPLINDWIDGENSREVKIPVTISNGVETVMVEVPLTILHDTRAADAVKAAEDASKAGADKKAEVETDGLVTPEEKAAVDGLNDTTTAKKEDASKLVDALPEIKQSSFMPFEKIFLITNDYSQFPKTGEKSDSILTIYGGLLFLSSIGLLGIKKRKNNTN